VPQVDGPAESVQPGVALDVDKTSLVACLRVPESKAGQPRQEVRTFSTLPGSLMKLTDWLRNERVETVTIQATSNHWKPVFYLLEAEGFTCSLLNAREVKTVPGRPKTDTVDAVWLAKIAERGICQPSLVHPKPIRQLRDLTRYRRSLIRERTGETQRCERLLGDAQITLSSLIGDLFGPCGRTMLEAMIAGQRDPKALAELAPGSMRANTEVLVEALTGHFDEHHAFLLQAMLRRIDALAAAIEAVSTRIEAVIAPFAQHIQRFDEITGVAHIAAQELISEIGVDATRFPTPAHLVAWAKYAPITNPADRKRGGCTRKGNRWLANTLDDIVATVSRTDTFLGDCYRHMAERQGENHATVAVGNSVLTIIWHLLSDPNARYHDLVEANFSATKSNTPRRQRDLVRQLERLTGQTVTRSPLPEQPAA
jgi:transposase